MISRLSELLQDLDAWADGTGREEFVFPLVLESTEELTSYRSSLRDGLWPLRKRLDDLGPDNVEAGDLTTAEMISLSLALLIQGYQIVRDHRAGPRVIPRDEFRLARRAYRLLKALGPRIASLDGDEDFGNVARSVTECRRAMKPIIAERLRAARERTDARKMGDAVSSVTVAAGSKDLSEPLQGEGSLDAVFESTVDTDLLMEAAADSQDMSASRRPRPTTSSLEASPLVSTGLREGPRKRTTFGAVVLVLLLLLAGFTVGPRLLRSSPKAGVYEEFVPVRGIVRLRDSPEAIIVLVDDRWDSIPATEREDGLRGLYEQANHLEDVTQITVRDARGKDAAQIIDGQVTFLPAP